MWWLILVVVCEAYEAHEALTVAGEAAALAVAVVRRAGGQADEAPLLCHGGCEQSGVCLLATDHPCCNNERLHRLWRRELGLLMVPMDAYAPLTMHNYMNYLGDLTEARRRHCTIPGGHAHNTLATLAEDHFRLPQSALQPYILDASGQLGELQVTSGTYTPEWCNTHQCATILTEELAEALLMAAVVRRGGLRAQVHVVRHIRKVAQLGPCVVCMGPQSGLIVGRVQLTPPPCEVGEDFCPFEPRRLPKLASWGNLHPGRRITQIMTRFNLTAQQYDELATLNAQEGRERAAVMWLERHEECLRSWMEVRGRHVKVDVGMMLHGDMMPAARVAEWDAAAQTLGVTFKVQAHHVGCDRIAMEKMLSDAVVSRAAMGAVVPACGAAAAAVRADNYGLVVAVADVGAESAAPVVRVGGARRALGAALWATMGALQWQRCTMLTEGEAADALEAPTHVTILHRLHLSTLYNDTDYDTLLQWAETSVRADAVLVVVGAESEALVVAARRAAQQAGLTAMWLMAGFYGRPSAAQGDIMVAPHWQRTDLQPITYVLPDEWKSRHSAACAPHQCAAPPTARAALLYDTIMLMFETVACVFRGSGGGGMGADMFREHNTTHKFKQCLLANNMTGLTGNMRFNDDLTRQIDVDVYQWQNETYVPVGVWAGGTLDIETGLLRWPGGRTPTDGERCDLDAWMRGRCGAGALAGVGLLLLLAAALAAMYVRAKRRAERRCATLLKQAAAKCDPAAPDEWEMPRSRVVINRRLGTGAFGAVYGGHALLDGVWTAVAVKTLRAGAGVEQKLEFLSEAESMKRLRHQNVVRLLGVVTASEPACLVLALQALGDLRGFLLARRGEGAGVGVRRLNRWALQAARALAYLRRQRLVHRDVAARNCLLSACRTLRLADFGMARPCGDGDYYRFGRKGMLPVRWMAPESVCLGVFSSASDVWSFGVLLYEIVTFGALPFQGFSNAQVLEQVKAGRTVPLPHGLSPQLESVMRSCWGRARESRPHAAALAAFLAEHPKLLAPCLGPPPSLPFPAPTTYTTPPISAATDLTELSDATESDAFLDDNASDILCHFPTEKPQ